MELMFYSAAAFNQNVNAWQTGQVTDMTYMFHSAEVFNQPLNSSRGAG